ncbi:MAG TPA: VWA domain-containing protein [Anaerolineales bacterium]|nr:VWA domain-containing protein [Anaerolineales bacterium]
MKPIYPLLKIFTIGCVGLTLSLAACSPASTPTIPLVEPPSGGDSAPVVPPVDSGGDSDAPEPAAGGDSGDSFSEEGSVLGSSPVESAALPPADGGVLAPSGDILPPEPFPTYVAPNPPLQSGILTAGDVDDNLNFDFYLGYTNRTLQNDTSQVLPAPLLNDRVILHLLDGQQRPLANARLTIAPNHSNQAITLYSGADGTAYFFPTYAGMRDAGTFSVTVESADGFAKDRFELFANDLKTTREVTFSLQTQSTSAIRALDLALVIDTTGSMGDELSYLTTELEAIVADVNAAYPSVDLRYALVVYRDEGDAYVVRSYDFTGNVREMRGWLADQSANGGGDYPEAMEQALAEANQLSWRGGETSRVLVLNADAPPHDENLQSTLAQSQIALQRGIRIYPLAASGVAETAEYLMRIMAVTSGGRYLFLTDDSGVGNAHAEPKVPCYVVTRLDQLLMRVLRYEVSGVRVEAQGGQIIRQVGDYQNGVCLLYQQ